MALISCSAVDLKQQIKQTFLLYLTGTGADPDKPRCKKKKELKKEKKMAKLAAKGEGKSEQAILVCKMYSNNIEFSNNLI